MEFKERAEFIENFIDTYCRPVMATKGEEYSRGEEDCNSNFKRVAEAVGADPVTICYVYLAKHLDSIASFVKTGEVKSDEPIEGRVGDAINYLLILASLIDEEKEQEIERVVHQCRVRDAHNRHEYDVDGEYYVCPGSLGG